MALTRLRLRDFRCFPTADLGLTGKNTVFWGANASGKTSLLEAVFYLAQGRSFRTNNPQELIRNQSEGFQIVAKLAKADRDIPIGVERHRRDQTMRLAGHNVKSWATMAQALPVQLIDAEIHRLLAEGPRYRRRFLDWGAFHVEHGFLDNWRRYQRALRQRNELLRHRAVARERHVWDQELAQTGELLSSQRADYLAKLKPLVTGFAQKILLVSGVELSYRPGWPIEADLLTAFRGGAQRDLQYGKTHFGPHRAELVTRIEGVDAQACLSRGQHKVLAACLVLAQGRVLADATTQQPVLLLDDLAAELDGEHLSRFMEALIEQPGQKIFTAITPDSLPLDYSTHPDSERSGLFHVERGRVGQG